MLSDQRKKLLFRAWHRGTREADLLMGRFAETMLPTLTDDEVNLFEMLLDESDPDIYDWVTLRLPLPQNQITPLLNRMIDFYRLNE
jgi:antitoxin CptB